MICQFEIWIADLNPQFGSEAGKIRPVLIIQTDLLNEAGHPSTIVCPITTNIQQLDFLRVSLLSGTANLAEDCDVMIDQIRAIDNSRLIKKIGNLPLPQRNKVIRNLKIILDLD